MHGSMRCLLWTERIIVTGKQGLWSCANWFQLWPISVTENETCCIKWKKKLYFWVNLKHRLTITWVFPDLLCVKYANTHLIWVTGVCHVYISMGVLCLQLLVQRQVSHIVNWQRKIFSNILAYNNLFQCYWWFQKGLFSLIMMKNCKFSKCVKFWC